MVKVLSCGALALRLFIRDRSYLVTSFVSDMGPWEITESPESVAQPDAALPGILLVHSRYTKRCIGHYSCLESSSILEVEHS